jgi:nucleosome binding factor SPN SPT16 subunit
MSAKMTRATSPIFASTFRHPDNLLVRRRIRFVKLFDPAILLLIQC